MISHTQPFLSAGTSVLFTLFPVVDTAVCVQLNTEMPAGLANITATYINLLGLEAPANYEASLLTV